MIFPLWFIVVSTEIILSRFCSSVIFKMGIVDILILNIPLICFFFNPDAVVNFE